MPYVYRCDTTYLAMNDQLTKHLGVDFVSETKLPPQFVVNAIRQRAYSIILSRNIGSPKPGSTAADLEIEVESCEESEI